MSSFLYENRRGSPTMALLNVLGLLNVPNVLNVLNVLIMPKDASLPAGPCFLNKYINYVIEDLEQVFIKWVCVV